MTELPNIKFHVNPFSSTWVVTGVKWTDRQADIVKMIGTFLQLHSECARIS
jgi:hypothetical protein